MCWNLWLLIRNGGPWSHCETRPWMADLELQWAKTMHCIVFHFPWSQSASQSPCPSFSVFWCIECQHYVAEACLWFCHIFKTWEKNQADDMRLLASVYLLGSTTIHHTTGLISELRSYVSAFIRPVSSSFPPCQVFCGRIRAQWAADCWASQEEDFEWSGGGFVQGCQGTWSCASGPGWERARRAQQSQGKVKLKDHCLYLLSFCIVTFNSAIPHVVFILSSHHLGLPRWRLQARSSSWGGVSLCGCREASLQHPAGCEYRPWWVLLFLLLCRSCFVSCIIGTSHAPLVPCQPREKEISHPDSLIVHHDVHLRITFVFMKPCHCSDSCRYHAVLYIVQSHVTTVYFYTRWSVSTDLALVEHCILLLLLCSQWCSVLAPSPSPASSCIVIPASLHLCSFNCCVSHALLCFWAQKVHVHLTHVGSRASHCQISNIYYCCIK